MPDSHLLSKTVIQNVSEELSNTNLDNLTSTGESHFQTPLVSGDNIKTINSNSLLGSGDLVITSVPVGTVLVFAGSTAPTGYLLCDGSAVSRTTYSSLFAVIGTTYGVGDNSSTFNLPNISDLYLLNGLNVDTPAQNCRGTGKTVGWFNGYEYFGVGCFYGTGGAAYSGLYNANVGSKSSGTFYNRIAGIGITTDSRYSGIYRDAVTSTVSNFVTVHSIIKY